MELLLRHNNKKLIAHVNRLKPYFVQSPGAVSSPDFFPVQKDATPHTPVPTQIETEFENFFPYEDEILDKEVNYSDPSPSTQRFPCQNSRPHRTPSSSSSAYGDMPEVTHTNPSPSHQLTYADVVHRPRQRLSSSSSASTHLSLPSDGIASRTRSSSCSLTPEQPKIYMPQITFDPLPVLKEGEGLEENDNVTINIVNGHNSWTVVRRKKKNKNKKDTLSEKWTKQRKENFEQFGDIWYQEPYDNYHVADHDTPAAKAPQPQAQVQQQPVLQQQPAGLPQPPMLPPQQPVIVPPQLLAPQPLPAAPLQLWQGVQPPVPKIVITPSPPQRTPKIQKCCLEAIPEEDEATGSPRPKMEAEDVLAAQGALGGGPPKTLDQLGRRRQADLSTTADEQLRDIFEQLALSPERKISLTSPPSSGEDTTPAFQSALSSPKTPKRVLLPPGATAGPLSQCTQQMEKDFADTLYKRLLETEALEKKKKKELASEREKEKKACKKAEDKLIKAVYKQALVTKIGEKQKIKEFKKEKK